MTGERGRTAVEFALRCYLAFFVLLSILGWLPELAGRLSQHAQPTTRSALFHPGQGFDDKAGFGDLTNFADRTRHMTGPGLLQGQGPFPYLPLSAFTFAFFLQCFRSPIAAYLVAFVASMAGLAAMLALALRRTTISRLLLVLVIGLTATFGYPQLFAGNRGNLEWINFGLSALGVAAFARRRYLATAALFGLSVCIKPFPILFFLLLLWRRRYREAALGAAVVVAVNLAALVALGPTLAIATHSILEGWKLYFEQYVVVLRPVEEFRFYHSLLDTYKVAIWYLFRHQANDLRPLTSNVPWWTRLDWLARANMAFALAATAWIWVRFARLPIANRIFALSIAVIILPYGAAEYTLLLIYIPFGLLLIFLVQDAATRRASITRTEMLRLLIPIAFLVTPLSDLAALSGVAKTIALIYLLIQAVKIPLPTTLFGELDPVTAESAEPQPLHPAENGRGSSPQ